MWNSIRTALLLGAMTGFLVLVGRVLGGQQGMVIALGIAVVMNLGSWWFSDKLLLARYHAHQIGPGQAPELHATVARLAARAGMPMPRLYLLPDAAPNAFATGRDPAHGAVAVTQGLLQLLRPDEVEAVVAHELAHIRSRDTLIGAVAASIAGAVSMLANMAQWALFLGGGRSNGDDRPSPLVLLLTMILAPLTATLIQMAVSRSREFAADESAARLVGSGEPLARALMRIEKGLGVRHMDASPETAHVFISNPLSTRGLMALFSTHPTTEARVARLMQIDVG